MSTALYPYRKRYNVSIQHRMRNIMASRHAGHHGKYRMNAPLRGRHRSIPCGKVFMYCSMYCTRTAHTAVYCYNA
ncbi:hypothetical protein J9A10_08355 [Bacteroides thetaiotaomicron]|nr:hypothetical protein [Bacteroides thetaiotaomicron]